MVKPATIGTLDLKKLAAKVSACIALLFLSACEDYPKDVNGTSDTIQENQLIRVGLIEHAPWVVDDQMGPQGIEVELLREFSASLGATPQWTFLSEAEAVEKLVHHELDIVIGGLTQSSPRKKEVGFTRPYSAVQNQETGGHVMAIAPGENQLVTTLETFLKSRKDGLTQNSQNEARE
ncbi:transporter substrate-binding domain-containing protein [Litorimonas haliclonae]|uniref:transporter substrate-binding domain-containing protein n=1 Tax=Litorimonas haliclonae TaxID=2081977 RepID=UPI0039F0429C